MSPELFYAPGTCAFAAIVAFEEAQADYRLRRLDFARGDQRSGDFLEINPLGRVPALRAPGVVLTELAAILAYIGASYPDAGLLPSDSALLARTYEYLSRFSSTFHLGVALTFRGERFSSDTDVQDKLKAPARAAFTDQLDRLEALYEGLVDGNLVGNRFGLADAFVLVVWRWAAKLEIDTVRYPAWTRTMAQHFERPSVLRAVAAEDGAPLWLGGEEGRAERSGR